MTDVPGWEYPPDRPDLADDVVHVWRVIIASHLDQAGHLADLLDDNEVVRSGRLVRAVDRERFTVTRALLRTILSRYLSAPPDGIEFQYGPRGKPSLAFAGSRLRFNLSHTREIALYAIARGREIGVDVEHIRLDYDFPLIADRFFSARESRALLALPAYLQREAFFRTWVRKEAYVKARGEGLTIPLDKFDVAMFPDPPLLSRVVGDPREAGRWSFHEFVPGPEHVAVLAVEGSGERLTFFQYGED